MRASRIISLATMVLASFSSLAAHAQTGGLVVAAPMDGAVFAPGSTVSVEVTGPDDLVAVSVLLPTLGFGAAHDDSAPFVVTVPLPLAAGAQQLIVLGEHKGGAVDAAAIGVVVALGSVVALSVEPREVQAGFGGEPIPLEVRAETAQGSLVNVTSASSGTTYQVQSGSAGLSVSADGVVIVESAPAGSDLGVVLVRHGALSVEVPVRAGAGFAAISLSAPSSISAVVGGTKTVALSATTTGPVGGTTTIGALDLPPFVTLASTGPGAAELRISPAPSHEGTYPIVLHAVYSAPSSDPDDLVPALSGDMTTVSLRVVRAMTPVTPGCGMGSELALALPLLSLLRVRVRRGRA